MTKTVAEQIIEVIEYLGQKFGMVIDWSAENLLPVAEHLGGRIVDWKIASSWFWIILCGIFFIAGIICIICGFKNGVEYDLGAVLFVIGIIASVFGVVGLGINIFELVKVLSFPELVIIEYIQNFMQ